MQRTQIATSIDEALVNSDQEPMQRVSGIEANTKVKDIMIARFLFLEGALASVRKVPRATDHLLGFGLRDVTMDANHHHDIYLTM